MVAIYLQNVKITLDGVSASASQVNGVCQSTLGQFGQALSSGFGNGTPQDVCSRAATVEDWKGITLWLGIALIAAGIGMIGRQAGWLPSRGARNITAWAAAQGSPAATLARAERAEAEAARLRAQAAQMQAGGPAQPGPHLQPGGPATGGWQSPEAPPTFQRGS